MCVKRILDCESAEAALYLLSNITGISSNEIKDFLIRFDMDNFYELHHDYLYTGDVLLKDTF